MLDSLVAEMKNISIGDLNIDNWKLVIYKDNGSRDRSQDNFLNVYDEDEKQLLKYCYSDGIIDIDKIINSDISEETKKFFVLEDDKIVNFKYWFQYSVGNDLSNILRYYVDSNKIRLTAHKFIQMTNKYRNEDWKLPSDFVDFNKEDFFNDINNEVLNKLVNKKIDIRDFYITRIDYCFNLYSDHTKEIVNFLNSVYTNPTYPNVKLHKVNLMNEEEIREWGGFFGYSFYLVSKSDYEKKKRTQYIINMYDKSSAYKQHFEKKMFTLFDVDPEIICTEKHEKYLGYYQKLANETKGILRVEIQLFSQKLRGLQKNKKFISLFPQLKNKKRRIGDWFDIDVALYLIDKLYSEQISKLDYYNFKTAKEILEKVNNWENVSDFCIKSLSSESRYQKINWGSQEFIFTNKIQKWGKNKIQHSVKKPKLSSKEKKAVEKLREVNIFPCGFLDKSLNINKIENPIKQIFENVQKWKESQETN